MKREVVSQNVLPTRGSETCHAFFSSLSWLPDVLA